MISSFSTHIGLLILRCAVCIPMLIIHGIPKINDTNMIIDVLKNNKFPFPDILGYLTISAETLFPVLIILGLFTRISAFVCSVNMFVAAFVFHYMIKGDTFAGFEKAYLYFIIFFFIIFAGAGNYSIDKYLSRK